MKKKIFIIRKILQRLGFEVSIEENTLIATKEDYKERIIVEVGDLATYVSYYYGDNFAHGLRIVAENKSVPNPKQLVGHINKLRSVWKKRI